MTTYFHGGRSDDYAIDRTTHLFLPGVAVTVLDDGTGSPVTGLVNAGGGTISGVETDGDGFIPKFGCNSPTIRYRYPDSVGTREVGPYSSATAQAQSLAAAAAAVVRTGVAKGSLIVGTAADTVGILPVGADGTRPVADSAQTTGIRWDGTALVPATRAITSTDGSITGVGALTGDLNLSIAPIITAKIANGAVTPAKLNASAGTASSTTFYRGDGQWAVPPGAGGGGVVSEPDYIIRLDPTGSASGDTAATEAAWATAAGASVAPYSTQNNRRGRVVIEYGAGRFTLNSDAPMMRALSTFPVSGMAFRGQGSDITEILFAPSAGVDTSCMFKNNNSWYNVQVEGMTLMSAFTGTPTATTGPAISEQTSTNPQAAAQNWRWRDVKIRGRWRAGNIMDGDNCNSEWFHHFLSFGTDCWFAEGWLFGDMSTDQGLNYDFVSCQVLQLLGGKFIRMNKGGAIRMYGGQLLLDNGALAFDLRGSTHDGFGTTEQLLVDGARAEIRGSTTQMLYSEWGSGAIRFNNYTDAVLPQTQSTFTFNPGSNRGPMVAFNGCYLTGRHEYRYNANKWQYPTTGIYRDCRIPVEPQSFITNVFDTAAGATDIPGGRAAVEFEGGVVVPGLTNPQRYRLQQAVNPESFMGRHRLRTARVRTSSGTTANGAHYAYLPLNAEVIRMRFVKPASGASTVTSWSLTLTDGNGATLGAITGTSTGKQWQEAVTASVDIGAIGTTDLGRQLTVTAANFPASLAATAGYVEIDYVA